MRSGDRSHCWSLRRTGSSSPTRCPTSCRRDEEDHRCFAHAATPPYLASVKPDVTLCQEGDGGNGSSCVGRSGPGEGSWAKKEYARTGRDDRPRMGYVVAVLCVCCPCASQYLNFAVFRRENEAERSRSRILFFRFDHEFSPKSSLFLSPRC